MEEAKFGVTMWGGLVLPRRSPKPNPLLQEECPPESEDESGDLETLRSKLKKLRSQYGKLQAALQSKGSDFIKCGYLFKYRPFASGLFMQPWEMRFFVLRRGVMEYYKTELDTQFPPRGIFKLQSCVVEVEPLKKRKYFTFSVIDEEDKTLALRVSTEDLADGERWVAAMESAGVARQDPSTTGPLRSPPPAKDIRTMRSPPATGNKVLERSVSADLRRRGFWKIPFFPSREEHEKPQGPEPKPELELPKAKHGPFTAAVPVHLEPKFSILSSEEVQKQQHSGLINLVFVIMFATHSRLIIENLLKYGMRFNPLYGVKALLESDVPWQVLAARVLEQELKALHAQRKKTDGDGSAGDNGIDAVDSSSKSSKWIEMLFALLQIILINSALLLPCFVIVYYKAPPLAGLLLCVAAVIVWMKLVSYAHCCNDLRAARRQNEIRPGERGNMSGFSGIQVPLIYPENITAKNLAYFMVAPTLCYQVNYPRASRFRKRWVVRRIMELVAWLSVGAFIVEQYILPSCLNSLHPLHTMDIGHVLERVLKLSLPSLYVWLIGFYSLFHLWLNILAELTYFGDREFYKDWWNATTVDEYWRSWNQPVHKWLMRTVYFPAHRIGMSKYGAIIVTFFISAVFHELLVGVPLQMLRAWAFVGMMGQIPLVAITNLLKRKLKSEMVGNIIFWLSFCIFGQPIAVLLYYHDYVQNNTL